MNHDLIKAKHIACYMKKVNPWHFYNVKDVNKYKKYREDHKHKSITTI